jgi:hypothetical protein
VKEWKQTLIGVLGTALLASIGAGIHLWGDNAVLKVRITNLEGKIKSVEDKVTDEAIWRTIGEMRKDLADVRERMAKVEGAKR